MKYEKHLDDRLKKKLRKMHQLTKRTKLSFYKISHITRSFYMKTVTLTHKINSDTYIIHSYR